jgi:class 3 adenylate cyclase
MRTTSLAAILFVELAGFGELLARDEPRAIDLLTKFRDGARPLIAEHGGELVDATGDELLVVFGSAVAAVQCALHLRLAGRLLLEGIQPRAGIHLGEIWRDETRVYGNGVNVAARVKAEAGPGRIVISEDVYRQISNKLDLPLRPLPERPLKNIERSLTLYEILEDGASDGAVDGSGEADASPTTVEKAAGSAVRSAADSPLSGSRSPEPPSPPLPPTEASLADSVSREAIQAIARNAVRNVVERAVEKGRITVRIGEAPPGKGREPGAQGEKGPGEDFDPGPTALVGPGRFEARRAKAAKEIRKGANNFLVAGALLGGFLYLYSRNPSIFYAAGAALFGLGPCLSGLKRLVMGLFELRDIRRDEEAD